MDWIKALIRWIIFVLLQVLLFDHLQWLGICHPQVYIVCLIMLPISLPVWADMLIGAVVGLVIDVYGNMVGVHMAACVAMMYLRRMLIPRFVSEYERISGEISSRSIGSLAMLQLTASLVALHHVLVGLLSAWSLAHIGMTLLGIILSAIIAWVLIMGYDKLHTLS